MRSSLGLQPSLVKQYVYCPVIPWIINKYGVTEPPTDSMALGKEEHNEEKQVRVKGGYGVAVLDELMEEPDGKVIVEKKTFRSRSIHRYLAQVITQYLIASEKIQGIRKAVIVNGDRRHEFKVTDDLVEEVKRIIYNCLKAMEDDKPPKPTVDKRRCSICWYRRFCPYH